MPNHLHGIIEINNKPDMLSEGRDALQCVSTGDKNKFGPQVNNLASIIRGFKGAVTKRIHLCDLYFFWQRNYYDHIIRNDESLNKIREYIIKNPEEWERDRNLPAGEAGNVENVWI